MSRPGPALSVIIPTHDRRASVCRTLTALASQSMDAGRFEVIVIADGCSDDTAAHLRVMQLPYQFQVIEQPGQGQGKARNVGAEQAAAPILVFLDDDIEPTRGMLDAYQRSHMLYPRHLILGPALPVLSEESSFFSHGLRNWWNDHLLALKQPAHRFSYRDMHSGNFSISAELFAEAGGFDPRFFGRSGEDYELGIRLMAMGVPFVLAGEASAFHHDATDLTRSLVRVRMEGRADVLIGLRYPELRGGTGVPRFCAPRSRLQRRLAHLAFHRPGIGDRVARLLLALLGPLEKMRVRRSWRSVHGAVRSYWYCRGAAEELRESAPGSTLEAFLAQIPRAESVLPDIDLQAGLTEAMRTLDRLRLPGVQVQLAGIPVGSIPAVPGAEPVRGAHLREFLTGEGQHNLLRAMAANRLRAGTPGLEP